MVILVGYMIFRKTCGLRDCSVGDFGNIVKDLDRFSGF